MSDNRKLLIGLALLLGIGFVATSLISYYVSREAIRHSIIADELPLTADNVYSEIHGDLVQPIFISSMMARNTFLQDWVKSGERNPEDIVHYLKEIRDQHGAFTAFFVSARTRNYYHEHGILKRISEQAPQDRWFFRMLESSTPYEIYVGTNEAHQLETTLFVDYQVRDRQGHVIGVTGVGLTVDALRRLIDDYQKRYQRNVFFTDQNGQIVLQGKTRQLPADNIHTLPGLGKHAAQILESKGGTYHYRWAQQGYQLTVRFIPELGWYLFVEKAEDQALADIKHALFINLLTCAIVTAIVLFLTHLGIRRYRQRLKRALDSHTNEMSQALAETHAANQARSHMLAYISHDLRAPLATIIHYTHLLNTYADKTAQRYQSAIERSAIHQLELIDELVEYARGELDRLELLPSPNYIHALLRDIADQAELLADQQCNRFTLKLGQHIPAIAVFDAKRLRQVLLNLLTNAAKFTQGGDIAMQVDAHHQSGTNRLVLRFEVTDTGPGIPSDDFERIFLPFERRKTSRPGSGLGLTIAYQVVRKMGGTLHIESEVGKGSCFWFEIETETAQESDVLQPATAFAMPEPFGSGKYVLVVDDDATNRDYLYEILVMADFDVVLAANGREALQAAETQNFDLILTDQIMPEIDGWELLRRLHALPDRVPPVMLCSGMPPQPPADFPCHMTFQAALLKPLYPDELLSIVKRLLMPEALIVPPSSEHLDALRNLMHACDLQGIEQWAGDIEDSIPHAAFAQAVKEAISRLDFAALEKLIEESVTQ